MPMSYQVLALKWRPQTFDQVVGQRHVTQTLKNSLAGDRLAHALLFSGPRGLGKTSVARILAKAVNCEGDGHERPCNRCHPCKEITSGASVDVLEIDGASNRGIDEVRELRENILFRPTSCRFKVYIIDEVHMLTREAFNALLKTLEEPPSHVYFILATTEPHKLLDTIKSRCQHHEFRRLEVEALASHLAMIVEAEELGLDQEAVRLLAREAEGSVRDALTLLDQVAAYGAKSYKEVCEALGVAGTRILEEMASALFAREAARALELVEQVYDLGGDVVKFAYDLVAFMRDLMVIKSVGKAKAQALVWMGGSEIERLAEMVNKIPLHHLVTLMDVLTEGYELLARSGTPRVSLELLLLRLCIIGETLGIEELIERLENGASLSLHEGPVAPQPSVPPQDNGGEPGDSPSVPLAEAPPVPAPEDSPPVPFTKGGGWEEFVTYVMERNSFIGSMLKDGKARPLAHGGLEVQVVSDLVRDLLESEDKKQLLGDLAFDFWGKETRIRFTGPHEKETKERPLTVDERVKDSPLVQEALRVFGARVAYVEPFSKTGGDGEG